MTSASEILDVSIGGFTTMRKKYLQSAAKPNGAQIPRNWSSNRCYEEMEREGLVLEILNTGRLGLQRRHWMITTVGRDVLSQVEQ